MIVEKYNVNEGVQKRRCEECDFRMQGSQYEAEFIFHYGSRENFLCREHLVQNLTRYPQTLAQFVIDTHFA